jgi:hypothetical protein
MNLIRRFLDSSVMTDVSFASFLPEIESATRDQHYANRCANRCADCGDIRTRAVVGV